MISDIADPMYSPQGPSDGSKTIILQMRTLVVREIPYLIHGSTEINVQHWCVLHLTK